MDFDSFIAGCRTRERETGERRGQALYNHLYKVRPDLALDLRTLDPFYLTFIPVETMAFLRSNW